MKSLFGDNRLANILTLLRKGSSMRVGMLADKLSVGERSIRNDIKVINGMLGDSGHIEIAQSLCSLRVFDAAGFQKAYARIIETDDLMNSSTARRHYIFGKLMRATAPVLTDELAYEMNVGRSTLIKDLKRLREDIAPYQLVIRGKTSQGLFLRGSELAIRRYVIEHAYSDLYGDYPMDAVIVETLNMAFSKNPFEQAVRRLFYQYLTLMLDRFLTGHFVGKLSESFYFLREQNGFNFVGSLVDQISELLHVRFPLEEKLYLLLPIIGMRTPQDDRQLYKIRLDKEARLLTQHIIAAIDNQLDIQIAPDELAEEFMYHLMFMINCLRYGIQIDNPLQEEIRKKYPLAYQMAGIAGGVVARECAVEVTADERGFLAAYFSVFIEAGDIYTRLRRIAVVCGAGIVTSRLIVLQLKKILDSNAEIAVFSLENLTEAKLMQYDTVISTVPLPFACEKPVIFIREIFDEDELRNRLRKAHFLLDESAIVDDNWYVLTSFVQPEHFFDLGDFTDYREAVDSMIDCLADEMLVDPAFKVRIWQRESQGSMVFDAHIAIPHTVQSVSDQMTIAFGVCNPPIPYRGSAVEMVVLLALPEKIKRENNAVLIRIYDELMTLVKDAELMAVVSQATTYTEFTRAFYKRA